MKRTREQIKAELMKEAEQEIDRLLDWEEKADKPTLTQYHYCAHCQAGFSPLDKQLQVWDAHWSEEVARLAVWLSGQATYGEASDILAEGGKSIFRPAPCGDRPNSGAGR